MDLGSNRSRKDTRAVVSLVARYRSPTTFEYVQEACCDVSLGGMFIQSGDPAAAGTLLKLECEADRNGGKIRGVARVVWLRREPNEYGPSGMGVKFVKLEPGSKETITRVVQELAAAGIHAQSVSAAPESRTKPPIVRSDAPATRAIDALPQTPSGTPGPRTSEPAAAPNGAPVAIASAATPSAAPEGHKVSESVRSDGVAPEPIAAAPTMATMVTMAAPLDGQPETEPPPGRRARDLTPAPVADSAPRGARSYSNLLAALAAAAVILSIGINVAKRGESRSSQREQPASAKQAPSAAVSGTHTAQTASAAEREPDRAAAQPAATPEMPAADAKPENAAPAQAAPTAEQANAAEQAKPADQANPVQAVPTIGAPAEANSPAREPASPPSSASPAASAPVAAAAAETQAAPNAPATAPPSAADKPTSAPSAAAAVAPAAPIQAPTAPTAAAASSTAAASPATQLATTTTSAAPSAPAPAAAATRPPLPPGQLPYVVTFLSRPTGAKVTVRGQSVVAPGDLDLGLMPQRVRVVAEKDGFETISVWLERVEFVESRGALRRTVTMMLQPLPPTVANDRR